MLKAALLKSCSPDVLDFISQASQLAWFYKLKFKASVRQKVEEILVYSPYSGRIGLGDIEDKLSSYEC